MNEDVRNWGHTSDLENGPSERDIPEVQRTHGVDCLCDGPALCQRTQAEEEADMMEAHQQYESEVRHLPESERPTFEEWLESPDPIDTDLCPEHKVQVPVEGFGSTGGPDPYSVAFLECGHAIWSPGPGDIAIYATDSKRLAKWNEAERQAAEDAWEARTERLNR